MEKLPVRYKRSQAAFQEFTQTPLFVEAMDAFIHRLNLLAMGQGDVSPFAIKMAGNPYILNAVIEENRLIVKIRDSTIVNRYGRHFCIGSVQIKIDTLLLEQAEFQLPCVNGWSGEHYITTMTNFKIGTSFVASILRLACLLHQKNGQSSFSGNAVSVQSNGILLREGERMRFGHDHVQRAYDSLFAVAAACCKEPNFMNDPEYAHETERMFTQEVIELAVLFQGLDQAKKNRYASDYVEILECMEARLRTLLSGKEREREKEVERQLVLLGERYNKKTD